MLNVAWYARDGWLDFLPLIDNEIQKEGLRLNSFYICNNELEKEHLLKTYANPRVSENSGSIRELFPNVDVSDEAMRRYEKEYDELPLVRLVWSVMFIQGLKEQEAKRSLISHLEYWKDFFIRNRIDVFISEQCSMLATCAAWAVCRKLGIEYICFLPYPPLEGRIAISNSFQGYIEDYFGELRNIKLDPGSESYREAVKCIEKLNSAPERITELKHYNDEFERSTKLGLAKLKRALEIKRLCQDYKCKKRYPYFYSNLFVNFIKTTMLYRLNRRLFKLFDVYERVPGKPERFFLLPLHMWGEFSHFTWAGLDYSDQVAMVKKISDCLPLGAKLYVKEHPARHGEKPLHHYYRLKKLRGVRLLSPHENTFNLVSKCEALVTMGSTMGLEALILGKPVITFADVWYKNLPGVHFSKEPEKIAEFMQNSRSLKTASATEKIKVLYTLHRMSFPGYTLAPRHLEADNIKSFATALKAHIDSMYAGACQTSV